MDGAAGAALVRFGPDCPTGQPPVIRGRWGGPGERECTAPTESRGRFAPAWPIEQHVTWFERGQDRCGRLDRARPGAFSGPGRAAEPVRVAWPPWHSNVFVPHVAYPATPNCPHYRQDSEQQLSPQLHILPHQIFCPTFHLETLL